MSLTNFRISATGPYNGSISSEDQWNHFIKRGDFNHDGRTDFVLAGWSFKSAGNQALNDPAKFFIFTQDANGNFVDSTSKLVANALINGAGDIGVADFNGDGTDDIALLGFTDFPVIPVTGTILFSGSNGQFVAQQTDALAIHGIAVGDWNGDGRPDLFGAGYQRPDPLMLYSSGQFVTFQQLPLIGAGGAGAAIGDVNGDGRPDLVVVDAFLNTSPTANDVLVFFQGADGKIPDAPNRTLTAELGTNSHEVRAQLVDLDRDGKLDLAVLETLFNGDNGLGSHISLWRNTGDGNFTPITSTWFSDQVAATQAPDYSWSWMDLDGDGSIDLALSKGSGTSTTQGNAIYLNDGSGKLHLVVHDAFVTMAQSVSAQLQSSANIFVDPNQVGDFTPFLNSSGHVDFFWTGTPFINNVSTGNISAHVFTDLDFNTMITTSYSLSGSDRGEFLHGWAGNDVFTGLGGNDTINGGSGLDIAVYSGVRSQYTTSISNDVTTVRDSIAGRDGTDTLTSVERLKFADSIVATDLDGNAGQAYRLYQAAFHRTPDTAGLSYWVNSLDHGATLNAVSGSFIKSAEFKATFGDPANLSNSQYLDVLYTNILGRPPEASGKAYWQGQLDSGLGRDAVLSSFSESTENKQIVGATIASGIVLDPLAFS